MAVSFSDLQLAFEFVSSGGMGENEAYLDRQSGKIYWHSEVLALTNARVTPEPVQLLAQSCTDPSQKGRSYAA